ncbi:MAG: hypothetical protein WBH85_11380 [Thermoanaerobaculia bacterium]
MRKKNRRILGWVAIGATVAVVSAVAMGTRGQETREPDGSVYTFSDVRKQTIEFHAYNRAITLTTEQEAVMREALTGLKAPCCSDKTALTCCCDCNMAKSWWGLSKHLIANQGLGAEQVQMAVAEWIEFINPDGFSGTACYIRRCSRPFEENGCGGMTEKNVIF